MQVAAFAVKVHRERPWEDHLRVVATRRDPGGAEGQEGTGPRQCRRQRTRAGIKPLETSEADTERHTSSNVTRGWKPVTATDPREGKPLKTAEPHGRYRVKAPERSEEEQVAEAVENGVSGATAGGGKPVQVDSPTRCVIGDGIPGEAFREAAAACWRGTGPAWKRVTEEATNLKRDEQTTVNHDGGRGARKDTGGRRREA